jgi:hypothetical protein
MLQDEKKRGGKIAIASAIVLVGLVVMSAVFGLIPGVLMFGGAAILAGGYGKLEISAAKRMEREKLKPITPVSPNSGPAQSNGMRNTVNGNNQRPDSVKGERPSGVERSSGGTPDKNTCGK